VASTSPQNKDYIMQAIKSRVRQFLLSEDGPTAVEYAVMVALVIVALVTVISNFTTAISGTFSSISTTLSTASGS
jgi:pilus assembly protein Flp/PilA